MNKFWKQPWDKLNPQLKKEVVGFMRFLCKEAGVTLRFCNTSETGAFAAVYQPHLKRILLRTFNEDFNYSLRIVLGNFFHELGHAYAHLFNNPYETEFIRRSKKRSTTLQEKIEATHLFILGESLADLLGYKLAKIYFPEMR